MTEQETQEVRRYLNVIKRAVSLVEGLLDNGDGGALEVMMAQEKGDVQPRIPAAPLPPVTSPSANPNVVFQTAAAPEDSPRPIITATKEPINEEHRQARQKHLGDLMAIDCWPEAVPQMLTKEPTEKEKNKRADMVIDTMVDRKLNDLKFLDFGCGEGHVAEKMALRGVSQSIGYDLEKKDVWKEFKNAQFTTDFHDLTNGELFDVIMLYDVLDHAEDPVDVMKKVKSLLSDKGVVYVRCHPWTSPHGRHLHTLNPDLNKAFMHLFMSWEEIYELCGKEPIYTRKELKPLDAYHWWFKEFNIKRERKMDNKEVSDFFFVESFKSLLATEQGIPLDDVDDLLETMKIQFIDYILVPK